MSYRRFADCSVSERMLYTLFIWLLGTGYLFAMVLMFITVATVDGKPGLSVTDIAIKYRGDRSNTRLEQALRGPMAANRTEAEFKTIVSWIHDGAPGPRFASEIQPILAERCVKCHAPDNAIGIPDLSGYEKVMKLVKVDTGEAFGSLVRVSHIHLFGLGIIFYLLGRIFILSEMPVWIKRVIVVIPFASIAMDIGSWWFTKYSVNPFAYVVMIGGGLMGLSFAFQAFFSLYQMWFYKHPYERRYEGGGRGERRGEYRRRGEG